MTRAREAVQHPGIGGTWHRHGHLRWWDAPDAETDTIGLWDRYERPECPVDTTAVGGDRCRLICERVTDQDGRGAFRCPHHGVFRVYEWPREERQTDQATLSEVLQA